MARNTVSLVTKRPGSRNYRCNFTVNGQRNRDSLHTDDKDTAEILAAKIRSDALLGELTGKKPNISLTNALGRYWVERGQFAANTRNIVNMSQRLIAGLKAETFLSKLDASAVTDYIANRRLSRKRTRGDGPLANGTINRELGLLRTVIRCARRWKKAVPDPDIEWSELFLDEPENFQNILKVEQEITLFEHLRADYHPLILFAIFSGVRLANIVNLTWKQVDETARTIHFRVKSKKPGRKLHVLPITEEISAILQRERGNHPKFVFTYVARRTRDYPRAKREAGNRYRFSQDGWRKPWKRARDAIGLPDLRFHDLRHTAATRALAAHGNLKGVQKMLGHANIATTGRYAAVDVEDLRSLMELAETHWRHRLPSQIEIDK